MVNKIDLRYSLKSSPTMLLLFLCLVFSLPLSGEESSPEPRYSVAISEAMGSNLFLWGVNRYIRQASYAFIGADSIYTNITSPWVWDQDEFSVNQIGHPYQGSFYYIAGRSNHLNFWESTVLTIAGSIVWELFLESETPSLNDLIATSLGGIAVGEMLHRLYVESDRRKSHLKYILSPMDSLNDALFGTPVRGEGYTGFTGGEISLAAGMVIGTPALDEDRELDPQTTDLSGFAKAVLVYGNPYGPFTGTPYEHFEMRARLNMTESYYTISLFSDGVLAALPLADSFPYQSALSLSLHYDFIFSSLINFAANSIGISYKSRYTPGQNWDISFKGHLNWVLLGASEYIYLHNSSSPLPANGEERRNYDLATGEGIKVYLDISHKKIGSLLVEYSVYGLHTISTSVPEYGSPGYSIIGLLDICLEKEFAASWSAGLSSASYHKEGFYDNAAMVNDVISSLNIYLKYRFQ